MSSQIASIVDYTAYLAAGIQDVPVLDGQTIGIRSVAGAGQGIWDDPLRAGQKIAPAGSNPIEELSHWSELPTAPGVTWVDQDGTVQLSWTIVMKLFFSRGDVARIRQLALPFYDRYLAVFAKLANYTLGGLALRTQLTSFAVMATEESEWAWLETRLLVVELVQY